MLNWPDLLMRKHQDLKTSSASFNSCIETLHILRDRHGLFGIDDLGAGRSSTTIAPVPQAAASATFMPNVPPPHSDLEAHH